jgi:hypothetical protein
VHEMRIEEQYWIKKQQEDNIQKSIKQQELQRKLDMQLREKHETQRKTRRIDKNYFEQMKEKDNKDRQKEIDERNIIKQRQKQLYSALEKQTQENIFKSHIENMMNPLEKQINSKNLKPILQSPPLLHPMPLSLSRNRTKPSISSAFSKPQHTDRVPQRCIKPMNVQWPNVFS